MRSSRSTFSLLPLTLGLGLAACEPTPTPVTSTNSSTSTAAPPQTTVATTAATTTPATTAAPALPPMTMPTPLAKPATSDELKSLASADNAFAIDFYARTRAAKGNLVTSPFSISTALTMTWLGAKGETAAQMAKVLHLGSGAERMADVAGSLAGSYGAPDNKVTLRVVNRLFGEKSYAFEQPFLARVQSSFGAPLESLDFKGAAQESRSHINAWVAGQTADRIKDLLPVPAINADTRLVLTNAVYFNGDWAEPFEKNRTRPAPFSVSASDKKEVPTMHQQESFRFVAADGVKLLELPYQNGALAMDFVLPDAVDGLDAVEKGLSAAVLDKWIAAAQSEKVSISLPRFEIAPDASLSLKDTLSAMGMPLPFERGKADFSGMAKPKNPEDQLYISSAFHKGFIRVDEKGTEAAAASAVAMARAGAAAPPAPPKEFKADHPFLFFLRDTRSGLVLFMGRVVDPSAK